MTTFCLSINPTLSPPSSCSSFSASPSLYAKFSVKVSNFSSKATKPINLFCKQASGLFYFENSKSLSQRKELFVVKASDMTITEVREEEEEGPPLLDSESNSRPRRIALFVEPSPFAYASFIF
jgi:sulfoquinovosyltransferase